MFQDEKMSFDDALVFLKNNGHLIEQHPAFPNRTNVEFVWQKKAGEYNVLVYERGCGITRACSSGAAAITWLLQDERPLRLSMLGGVVVTGVVEGPGGVTISLQAQAHCVFEGILVSFPSADSKTHM